MKNLMGIKTDIDLDSHNQKSQLFELVSD